MDTNWFYVAGEVFVALLAVLGNLLVIYVFFANKRLRSYRNYYIVGLGFADLVIGLVGIPLALYVDITGEPKNVYGCLFINCIVILCCLVSILCLLAVSIDRFWATFNPLNYYKLMSGKIAFGILSACVLFGTLIGLLPMFGWFKTEVKSWDWTDPKTRCSFVTIIDYDYLAFIYFALIITPALLMAGFYGYIYRFIIIRTRMKRRGKTIRNPAGNNENVSGDGASTETEEVKTEKSKQKEARAGKKLSSIILFFLICWMPLNTLNCISAFCGDCLNFLPIWVWEFTVILSHANSAINPFLYAYHLKEFRIAMKNVLLVAPKAARWFSCGFFEPSTGTGGPQPITSQSHSVL